MQWTAAEEKKKGEDENKKKLKNEILQWDAMDGKNEKDMPCAFNMQTFLFVRAFYSFSRLAWDMGNLHDPLVFASLPPTTLEKTKSCYITNTTKWNELLLKAPFFFFFLLFSSCLD